MVKNLISKIFGRKKPKYYNTLDATNYNPSVDDLRDFVTKWNLNFPIDRWWRKKHGIAFNSPTHREVSFIDMRIEWEEDRLFEKIYSEEEYILNSGDYMREKEDTRTDEQKKKDFEKDFRELMAKQKSK